MRPSVHNMSTGDSQQAKQSVLCPCRVGHQSRTEVCPLKPRTVSVTPTCPPASLSEQSGARSSSQVYHHLCFFFSTTAACGLSSASRPVSFKVIRGMILQASLAVGNFLRLGWGCSVAEVGCGGMPGQGRDPVISAHLS